MSTLWATYLREALPPLSSAEQDAVEQLIGIELPASLRALFGVVGGGRFSSSPFRTPDRFEHGIGSLLSMRSDRTPERFDKTEFVKTYRSLVGKVLPTTLVPFATAPAGDYYAVRRHDAAIVIWHHDTHFEDERECLMSPSLEELFKLLPRLTEP